MDWLIHGAAILLTLLLGLVKSLGYQPALVSDFELARKAEAGDPGALREQTRRPLLPTFMAFKRLKEIILTLGLLSLLFATQPLWLAALLGFVYMVLAEVIAARGWLRRLAGRAEQTFEHHGNAVQKSGRFVRPLASAPRDSSRQPRIASRDEFTTIITNDTSLFSAIEKKRLLQALAFDTSTIADHMVLAKNMITVDLSETIGPVVLDRLHKAGHQVFPVIKKDRNHLQGLLYMQDVALLGAQVEKVKDALRPRIFYLPASAPLRAVIAASLQTGRQLFIVVNETGETAGLITLSDVLTILLGDRPSADSPVTTDPKKVS